MQDPVSPGMDVPVSSSAQRNGGGFSPLSYTWGKEEEENEDREEKGWPFCSPGSSSELLSPSADETNPWASSCWVPTAAPQEGAPCTGLSPELQPEDAQRRMVEHAAAESHLWMAAPSAGR